MVRELTKTVEQRKVLSEQGKYFYNTALSEIVGLLNGSLDPAYFKSEVITVGSDIVLEKDAASNGGDFVQTTTTPTKTVTMSSIVIPVGSIVSVVTQSGGSLQSQWTGKAVSASSNGLVTTYTLLSGSAAAWNDGLGQGFIAIQKTLSTLSYDLSNLSKPYDVIVEILDSNKGQCVRVTPGEFYSIGRTDFAHKSYDDDIIWTQVGNIVYFRNGANVTAGTKTVIYQRQPDYPVLYDDNESVDLADKHVPLLAKRIYTYLVLQTESDVPKNLSQEMQMDYAQISAFAQSELQNKRGDKK